MEKHELKLSQDSGENALSAAIHHSVTDLPQEDIALLRAAREVAPMAFNPVSGFQVGAAVRNTEGRIFSGTFLESSALPLGVCAEPAALLAAFSAGSRELTVVAVVGGDPAAGEPGVPITPCGGCRQRIYDTTGGAARNIRVLCSDLALNRVLDVRILDLLPFAFDPSVLPAGAWSPPT